MTALAFHTLQTGTQQCFALEMGYNEPTQVDTAQTDSQLLLTVLICWPVDLSVVRGWSKSPFSWRFIKPITRAVCRKITLKRRSTPCMSSITMVLGCCWDCHAYVPHQACSQRRMRIVSE